MQGKSKMDKIKMAYVAEIIRAYPTITMLECSKLVRKEFGGHLTFGKLMQSFFDAGGRMEEERSDPRIVEAVRKWWNGEIKRRTLDMIRTIASVSNDGRPDGAVYKFELRIGADCIDGHASVLGGELRYDNRFLQLDTDD